MTDLFLQRGAHLSACRQYRYRLWRTWDNTKPPIAFIMLNPSVADEQDDDPTISRCIRRAEALGAGGIIVMNLFAFISTARARIRTVDDPVGPDTDAELLDACRNALHVICAWGNDGTLHGRDRRVLALLRANGIRPMALHINKGGSPKHPLYVKHGKPLLPFDAGS